MKTINLFDAVGDFAGDKDAARLMRTEQLEPALQRGEEVTLDFAGVDLATQSFIHALVSHPVRAGEFNALELITFAHCTDSVRELIEIVVDYSQDAVDEVIEAEERS